MVTVLCGSLAVASAAP
ncbi:hypothetical protein NM449_14610 [Vibrio metschnikovii]